MTDEPADSDHPKPRPRWFQFDLRLLFVIIAAIGVILALEVARGPRKTQRSFLDTLQVGDFVDVQRTDRGWIILYDSSRPSPATISEIGQDFIGVRYATGVELFIPLNQIDRVQRDPASAPGTKTHVPSKTSAVSDLFGGFRAPTKTQTPAKR